MKLRFLPAGLMLGLAAVCMLPACNNKNASDSDTAAVVEDSTLQQEADAANVILINDTMAQKYSQAFFNDKAKQSENPSDSTWVETSTGLKYVIVKEGNGAQPTAADQVTVHYTGRLLNNEIFDSSVSRGMPATFPLTQVIPGWTEGLQYMKEGGVATFYIPSNIAYGERGAGEQIPPNTDLIFDVQLISVQANQ